jgi:two-component system, OmpR family, sensor kinase
MKLVTRIWSVSAMFIAVTFVVIVIALTPMRPLLDMSSWAPGPVTVIDSAGQHHAFDPASLPGRRPIILPVVLALLVFAALLAASFVVARSMLKPMHALQRAAKQLGRGDWNARANVTSNDEIGDVATTFDDMANRVQSLVRAQRELLANVSHELRTPLARVRVALEFLDDNPAVGDVQQHIAEVEQLIEDLLTASRLDPALHGPQHVSPTLAHEQILSTDLLGLAAQRFAKQWPQRLHITQEAHLFVGDQRLLLRCLDNVLDNAGKYTPTDSAVHLRGHVEADVFVMDVTDEGPGVSDDDLELLGTAFFRAERSRSQLSAKGVGLGLVLCRRIVEAHGGVFRVERAPTGTGLRFTIRIPTAQTT